ncbi:porin [Antarctobacter jejuensis]|uniref:porin n=1 Tax=Antarctobacter jejuensis TaxID=1439938 RepID=UPI003FD219A7
MRTSSLLAAGAFFVASSVSAQELTYGGLLADYQSLDTDGVSIDATIFAAEFGVKLGSGFDAWLGGMTADVDSDAAAVTLTLDTYNLGLGYTFGEYFRADLSASSLSGGVVAGLNLHLKEAGLAYDNGNYFGRVSYSEVENKNLVGVDSLWGLHVGYEGPQGLNASVSAHWVDDQFNAIDTPLMIVTLGYDGGNWQANLDAATIDIASTDLSLVALSGEYDFNPKFSVYGSYVYLSADSQDLDGFRLGAAYNFTPKARVFADASKFSASGIDDVTGVGIGISMDLGDKPASYETTTDRLSGIGEHIFGLQF